MSDLTERGVVCCTRSASMLTTAVMVFLVALASSCGPCGAVGEEAARLAISGGVRDYVDIENERLRLMIPAELCPPEEVKQFLLDSLTQSLLFVCDMFGYRANRPLLHIWDDTQPEQMGGCGPRGGKRPGIW